jgi:purine-binding chemotaxis protein CheW
LKPITISLPENCCGIWSSCREVVVVIKGNSYFIFSSHHSRYAIDALAVRETVCLPEFNPVEEVPTYIVGVINFRGRILPLMDLNIRFGRTPERYRLTDGIILVEAGGRQTGLIVTDVHDVMTILPEELDPAPYPAEAGDPRPRFVIGEARMGEDIVMVLDHELLCGSMELPHIPWEDMKAQSGVAEPSAAVFRDEEQEQFHRRALEIMIRPEEQELADTIQMAVVLLSGEYFGVELALIREFSPITTCTPIPNCPEQIVGAMNLRGGIITLLDIRPALEMPSGRFAGTAKVVVVSHEGEVVGVTVDDIVDIATLSPADISPLPASISPHVSPYATGVAGFGDRSMVLLDLKELLAIKEFTVDDEQ